jgi:hypothetical protein
MNTKSYFLAFIVCGVCIAGIVMASHLHAQTAGETAKTQLSFSGLGKDQEIRFFVSTKHAHFGAAFLRFEVEVSNQPQPEAKIRLCINASMIVPQVEKEWGHHVGEQITRPLSPEDLQTLENFLTSYRAKGAVPPPSSSGHPAMEFNLITNRMAKEGFIRPDIDKREFYNPSEEAERDFIKNFIGFSEPGSN